MSFPFRGLWRHPNFPVLWAGQATSMFGSLTGGFAFSLVAVITLHASPAQVALLAACSYLPKIVAGPWVGVLADRVRRRYLLITADLARAAVLASIPVAALMHSLTIEQLYVVATAISVLTILFDVSFRAYVPAIVGHHLLVEANSTLRGTEAVAETGGFAVAGLLVQIFSAPITIAIDAVSFLFSALSLSTIRRRDEPQRHVASPSAQTSLRRDILAGVQMVWRRPELRAITITSVAWDGVSNAVGVVIILFFVRDLHLQPAAMGPVFAIGGISAFFGALIAGPVTRRLGLGRALTASLYVSAIGLLPVVLAGGPLPLVLALMGLAQATDGGQSIYEINAVTVLQRFAPRGAEGRVFATYETLRSAAMLVGLTLGGVLGGIIGLRGVLVLALAAHMLVPLAIMFSPLRREKRRAEHGAAEEMVPVESGHALEGAVRG